MNKNITVHSRGNKVNEVFRMIKPVPLCREEFELLKLNWNLEVPIHRYYALSRTGRYYFFPKNDKNVTYGTIFSIIRLMDRIGLTWNRDRYGKYETYLYRNVITQVRNSQDIAFPDEAMEEIFQRMFVRMIAFAYRIKDINYWAENEFRKLTGRA